MSEIDRLKAHVDAAHQAASTPAIADAESWIPVPLQDALREDGWKALWAVVRALQREHGAVYNQFTERGLVSQVLEVMRDAEAVPTVASLAASLKERAAAEGPWLVSTPLANIEMRIDSPIAEIDETALVWRAKLGDTEWRGVETGYRDNDEASRLVVQQILNDSIARPTKWLTYGVKDDIDTGRTATLLTREEGPVGVALQRAHAKAQYALATWTLLAPPGQGRVMPDIGVWGPQPTVRIPQKYKKQEVGVWPTREPERGGWISTHRGYELPADPVLSTPFQAFAARDRRPAQALLSATLALHSASRGSRFMLSERLRAVQSALEMLCESKPGARDAGDRWGRVIRAFDVDAEIAGRGYLSGDTKAITSRLKGARNIATHGADAVLIDFGWPAGVTRPLSPKQEARPDQLGGNALHTELQMLTHAVAVVLERLWPVVRDSQFDEATFESYFL